jgi:hypothetical protein
MGWSLRRVSENTTGSSQNALARSMRPGFRSQFLLTPSFSLANKINTAERAVGWLSQVKEVSWLASPVDPSIPPY